MYIFYYAFEKQAPTIYERNYPKTYLGRLQLMFEQNRGNKQRWAREALKSSFTWPLSPTPQYPQPESNNLSMSMSLSSKCSHPIILNMVYLYHYINYLTQCTHSVTTVISTLYPSVYCHCHLAAYLISSILSCLTITHSLHSLLL